MLWFDWQFESGAQAQPRPALVREANPRAARLFGEQRGAALQGRALQSLFARGSWERIQRELEHLGESAPRSLPVELLGRDGQPVSAEALLLALGDPQQNGIPALLVLRPGEPARAQPQDAALVCSRLAHGVLHDLRSPLMAISGFAEVLELRHAAGLGTDARRCLDNIVAASQRMQHMLELFSGYTRMGAGELELRPLDLGELLRGLCAEHLDEPIELRAEAGLPLVLGDAAVLRESFAALLALAGRGRPSVASARLRLEARDAHGALEIELRGWELPPPADAEDAARRELEFALARRALELHGGRLSRAHCGPGELVQRIELPGHPCAEGSRNA